MLGCLGLLGGGMNPVHAESRTPCESVCENRGVGISIQNQWDRLFRGQRVCRVEAVGARPEDPLRWVEAHRDALTGARMAAAFLTGGCRMNRPVRPEFQEAMELEGSEGLVRRSLERVGLQQKSGCVREVPAGAPLAGGDVLRLGKQAMIVASVGDDPFGIQARLASYSGPLDFSTKNPSRVGQLCREWLMDSSKFQISVIFLSQDGSRKTKLRQGTFGALISEDHPGSQWDQALQDWAFPECIQTLLGQKPVGHIERILAGSPPKLKVERYPGTAKGCRLPFPGSAGSPERECAVCCAASGRTP